MLAARTTPERPLWTVPPVQITCSLRLTRNLCLANKVPLYHNKSKSTSQRIHYKAEGQQQEKVNKEKVNKLRGPVERQEKAGRKKEARWREEVHEASADQVSRTS